jgi:hypothetical protein
MNMEMNQHDSYITAPDDSARIPHEAIPTPSQVKLVIPGPTDDQGSTRSRNSADSSKRGKHYGMRLAWRGQHLLGVAFGIAGAWFIAAWVGHGRMPLGLSPAPRLGLGIGGATPPSRILPPMWLLAIVGLFVLLSICMMLLGTNDVTPKLNRSEEA